MSRLGHFDTGPFWKWAVLEVGRFDPHPCEPVYLSFFKTKQFIELCFFPDNKLY